MNVTAHNLALRIIHVIKIAFFLLDNLLLFLVIKKFFSILLNKK